MEAETAALERALGAGGTHNIDRLLRLPGTVNYPNKAKLAKGRSVTRARLIFAGSTLYRPDQVGSLVNGHLVGAGLVRSRKTSASIGHTVDPPEVQALIKRLEQAQVAGVIGKLEDLADDLQARLADAMALNPETMADRDYGRRKRLADRWAGLVDDLTEAGRDNSRSGADMSLAAMLKAAGFAPVDAALILLAFKHGKANNEEWPTEALRLRHVARSVLRSHEPSSPGQDASEAPDGGAAQEPPEDGADPTAAKGSQQGRILSGADFMDRHVAPEWLIDGIVQRGRLYACTSLTGHGKTAVWLFNAMMIQAGRMIGGLETYSGNVLVLAGENPADLEARMIGMCVAYNLPPPITPYVLPYSFPMTSEEAEALRKEIASMDLPLALIVGDTAASFFPGDDENDNVVAGGYARTLRTFTKCAGNPAVVALAHPVKNAGRENLLPRGGGAFLNELDGNLTLWCDAVGETTTLHWRGKIRGPDFSPFSYRLRQVKTGLVDERQREEMTIIAEPMSEEAAANQRKQRLADEDAVLVHLRAQPGKSMAKIAEDAGWVDDAGRPQKWKVQQAIDALKDDKLVSQPRKGAGWKITKVGVGYLDSKLV